MPKLGLDPLVGDDRHPALDNGHDRLLADDGGVALVPGMDGDSDVGEDRRRPHRRHGDVTRAVRERVADVVERVVDVRVLDLEIRDGAAAARAPVDDAVVAVDPAAPVEMHEEAQHGPDVGLVHREALAPVVERGAQPAVLVHDHAAVPLEPLPDARLERLAAEILPGQPLLGQLPLDDVLGRDPGVVVARLPERRRSPASGASG